MNLTRRSTSVYFKSTRLVGSKFTGGIFGWILLDLGAGAVPFLILVASPKRNTGMYEPAIHVIAIVMVCSLVLPQLARRPKHEPEKLPSMQDHEAAA